VTRNGKWLLLALLASASALAPLATAAGQGTPAEDARAAKLVAEADSLRLGIDNAVAEVNELAQRLAEAEGEERIVIGRQVNRARRDALEYLSSLISNVAEQEELGLDTTVLRGDLGAFLKGVPEVVRSRINELEEIIAERRAERATTPPDALPALEQRIAENTTWLDGLLGTYVDIIDHMEELGLDTSAERDYLSEHLMRRAGVIAERVGLAVEEVRSLQSRLRRTPESQDLLSSLHAAEGRRDAIMRDLSGTVELLKRLELDTTTYRQLIIEATGELTADVLDFGVASGLARTWFASAGEWFRLSGPRIFFKIILFLIVLFLFRLAAKLARKIARRVVSSPQRRLSHLLQESLVTATGWGVLVVGFLVALGMIGVHITPFLAGLGIVGFVLGFALQDTLSNFASGAMILAYRPYDVGDLVEAGGAFGKVTRMTMVNTTILTFDNQTLVVPNNMIWRDVIKNLTYQRTRRVDLKFGISYSDDIPKAEEILKSVLNDHDRILDDPKPLVKVDALGESSVELIVRPWVKTDDYWEVKWDVTREVKMRFDREGITIPFPQRDVHVRGEDDGGG
jgi:small conductance mechanosensitive channel